MSDHRFYYKQSRLKQLRAFCYAAQTGSISKAAERLHLSQPSVSLQIKALERELAAELFVRRGPYIELSNDGDLLYELALPLVDGIDAIPQVFSERRGMNNPGELHIAAGEATILYLLPPAMKHFAEHCPQVRVRLHNVNGVEGLQLLRENQIDFAVGSFLDVPEDVEYQPLYGFDPVLITAFDHPLLEKEDFQLADISPYGLILPPRHLSTWQTVRSVFVKQQVDYHVILEAGGWEVIKRYVEMGLGVSIVTSICLTGQEALGKIPLNRYFPRRDYGIVLRRNKLLSAHAQRFIQLLRADANL